MSALAIGAIAARFLGEDAITSGALAGLSVLAVVASMNDTNGAMFVTLMHQFARPKDTAAYGMMSIESGPFFTMVPGRPRARRPTPGRPCWARCCR